MASKAIYKEADGYKAEDLLQSSLHHYGAARNLFDASPDYLDSAGYLLHLSIELLFKSWILHTQKEFEGTHSLQRLREQLLSSDADLNFTKKQNNIIEYLDGLYELRYPNSHKPTEVGSEIIELANEVIRRVIKILPDSLFSKFESIPPGKKGGRVLMKKPKSIQTDFDLLRNKK
jgi:HEPN domain-containing protein